MLFSLIICTHNRARLLERALESASSQKFSPEEYEILVINNASTDETAQVVSACAARCPRMRGIYEPQIGLSAARNHGWREACGRYLAYVDDDVILPEDYLENARRAVERANPAVLGGPYRPYYEVAPPRWYKDDYGSLDFGPAPRSLGENEYLVGCNFILQADALELAGGFSPALGMSGKKFAYGEETAVQKRLRSMHPDLVIYYDPSITLLHAVRRDQLTWRAMISQHFAAGRYNFLALRERGDRIRFRHVLIFLGLPILILFESTLGALFRDRSRFPAAQNYFFERVLRQVEVFGRACERMRILFTGKP